MSYFMGALEFCICSIMMPVVVRLYCQCDLVRIPQKTTRERIPTDAFLRIGVLPRMCEFPCLMIPDWIKQEKASCVSPFISPCFLIVNAM